MRDTYRFTSYSGSETVSEIQRGSFPADGNSWTKIATRPYDGRNVTHYVSERDIQEQIDSYRKEGNVKFSITFDDQTRLMMNDYVQANVDGAPVVFAPTSRLNDKNLNKLFDEASTCKFLSNTYLETLNSNDEGSYVTVNGGVATITTRANVRRVVDNIWDTNLMFEGRIKRVHDGSVVVEQNGLEQVWPNPSLKGNEPERLISLLQNPWCMQPLLTACSGFTTLLTQNYKSPLELISVPWNRLGEFSGLSSELKDTIRCYVFHYDSAKNTPRGRIIQRYVNASNNHPSNYAILPGRKPDRIEVDGINHIMTFHYSNPRLILSRAYSETTWDAVANRKEVFVMNEQSWIDMSIKLFDRTHVYIHNAGVDTASKTRKRGNLGKVFKVENYRDVLPTSIQQLERNLIENKKRSNNCTTFMDTYKRQRAEENLDANTFQFSRPFVVVCLERNLQTIRQKYSEYVPMLDKRMKSSAYYGFSFIEFVEDMLMTEGLSNTDRAWIWLYCTHVNDMDSKIYSVMYGATMAGQCDYAKLECPNESMNLVQYVTDIMSRVMISFKVLLDFANRNAEQAEMLWAIVRNFVMYSGLVTAGLAAQAAAASTATSLGGVSGFLSGIATSISGGVSFIAGLGAAVSSVVNTISLIITFVVSQSLIIIALLVSIGILLVVFAYIIVKAELELAGELNTAERTLYKRILYRDYEGDVMQFVNDNGERVIVKETNGSEVLEELQERCKTRQRVREERNATLQLEDMASTFEESFLKRQREVHSNPLDMHRARRETRYKTKRLTSMATFETLRWLRTEGDVVVMGKPVFTNLTVGPVVPTVVMERSIDTTRVQTAEPIPSITVSMNSTTVFSILLLPKYAVVNLDGYTGENVSGVLLSCETTSNKTSFAYVIRYQDHKTLKTNVVTVNTVGKGQMNVSDMIGRDFEITKDANESSIRVRYAYTAFISVQYVPLQMVQTGQFGITLIPDRHTIAIWAYEDNSLPEYYHFSPESYTTIRNALVEIGGTITPPISEAVHEWGLSSRDEHVLNQLREASTKPPETKAKRTLRLASLLSRT